MNIRAFSTWCKEVGVNPYYSDNIEYVKKSMRVGGYQYSHCLKVSYLDKKTARDNVLLHCATYEIDDAVYHEVLIFNSNYYDIYIFYKATT
jgi:hypothetical protein